MMDSPCAVGGTPSIAPVLLPPMSVKAVDTFICSMLPVETCISAFPDKLTAAPVSYATAHMKLLPPIEQVSLYGANVVKKTLPVGNADGSVITRSAS